MNISLGKKNLLVIAGGAALDLHNVEPKKCLWISDSTWLNLIQLSNVRPFGHLIDNINGNEKQWKTWFSKEAPENEPAPEPYKNLDMFKRSLLIR